MTKFTQNSKNNAITDHPRPICCLQSMEPKQHREPHKNLGTIKKWLTFGKKWPNSLKIPKSLHYWPTYTHLLSTKHGANTTSGTTKHLGNHQKILIFGRKLQNSLKIPKITTLVTNLGPFAVYKVWSQNNTGNHKKITEPSKNNLLLVKNDQIHSKYQN